MVELGKGTKRPHTSDGVSQVPRHWLRIRLPKAATGEERKRVIGVEPATFCLEGCRHRLQTTDTAKVYKTAVRDVSDTASNQVNAGLLGLHEDKQASGQELKRLTEKWSWLPRSVRDGIMAIIDGCLQE